MGRILYSKEEIDSFEMDMKRLDEDIKSILSKYHECGHALTNKLLRAAVKHLVYSIDSGFFEGLGYLHNHLNECYISETKQRQNLINN